MRSESLNLTNGIVRWIPTDRMLADGLTKDRQEPADLLRACVRQGMYQISPEELILQQQARVHGTVERSGKIGSSG